MKIVEVRKIDGLKLTEMILTGANHLKNNSDKIDALNVFPVPDGDTGTNMNLSMTSGVEEVKNINSTNVSEVAQAFSKGLLMGARGNSGVILSQIFRGFASGLADKSEVTTSELAQAFDQGVKTAYQAVMKPVEGTILTVAKDVAKVAVKEAKYEQNMIDFMEKIVQESKASLKRTPDLLPILKEVGVVDSGGQGLVTIYEGFLASLKGEQLPEVSIEPTDMEDMIKAEHHKVAQDFMTADEIEFGYCTEFMVKFDQEKLKKNPFDEVDYRNHLSEHGDSLLVVSDHEVVKVHIHTEYPGDVMTYSQKYGDLINIDIENMREQHSTIVESKKQPIEKAPYGIITVALGSGIKELFESLGATVVLEGGQTMNPSTKDISEAIKQAHAKQIIILPNNKNIVMAAEQAAELAEEDVVVVPTATIPQGISALLAFHPEGDLTENKTQMTEAISDVKTGQVTYAVRDTEINGLLIKKGQFMGIAEGEITCCHDERDETLRQLVKDLLTEDDEILTVLYGEDVTEHVVKQLVVDLEEAYPDLEIEIHKGGQPIYSYILSVE